MCPQVVNTSLPDYTASRHSRQSSSQRKRENFITCFAEDHRMLWPKTATPNIKNIIFMFIITLTSSLILLCPGNTYEGHRCKISYQFTTITNQCRETVIVVYKPVNPWLQYQSKASNMVMLAWSHTIVLFNLSHNPAHRVDRVDPATWVCRAILVRFKCSCALSASLVCNSRKTDCNAMNQNIRRFRKFGHYSDTISVYFSRKKSITLFWMRLFSRKPEFPLSKVM